MLSELLTQAGMKAGYIGTLGSSITDEIPFVHTTPDPPVLFELLDIALRKGFKGVVLEVSSHAIAQEKISPLRFCAAAFTSFDRDHLDSAVGS